MSVHLYNSLTRKKEAFLPQHPPRVSLYTCGVTVYDDSHIGHARSLYTFDVIKRFLVSRGFEVTMVRNITDIDDKIINRSRELHVPWKELVDRYIARYYEDLKSLGIDAADAEPRATENIPEMVGFIQRLIEKGYAYESGGDVYFSVRKFPSYGKLSGQSIEEMAVGVRIDPTELKQDHLDFALWKKSKEDEPVWKSPWGDGRPGWHIECSVMSQKYLKTETLDIHAGGRDLIFPHHENEIAQAEALTGKTFARYWIHHGLLTINGQKMSKSLGNFVTIKDFIGRYVDPDLLKLFFLSAHYAHPIDYNEEKIEECRKQKKHIDNFFESVDNWQVADSKSGVPLSDKHKNRIDAISQKFRDCLDDDFNTPQGLACIFELVDTASGFVSSDNEPAFAYAKNALTEMLHILGLRVKPHEPLPPEALELAQARVLAKKDKDFARADALREEIKNRYSLLIADTVRGFTFTKL
jgi:cysteinyl-tRNA synthetase